MLPIRDRQQRLQAAQVAVGPPLLGKLHARARKVRGPPLQLALQLGEEGEGVGHGPGEAGQDPIVP